MSDKTNPNFAAQVDDVLTVHGKLRAHLFLIHKAHVDLDGRDKAIARLRQVRSHSDVEAYVNEIVPRINEDRALRRALRKHGSAR